MNSLVNYVSDCENSSGSENGQVLPTVPKTNLSCKGATDAVYDAVPMEMSEESNGYSPENPNGVRSPGSPQSHGFHRLDSTEFSSDHRRGEPEEVGPTPPNSHKGLPNVYTSEKLERDDHDDYDRMNGDKEHGKKCKDREIKKDRDDERRSCYDDKKSDYPDERKERCDKANRDGNKDEKPYYRDDRKDRDKKKEKDKRRDRDRGRDGEKDKDHDRDRNRDWDKNRDHGKFKEKYRSTERDRNRDKFRDRRHVKDEKLRGWQKIYRRSKDREKIRSRSRSKDRKPFISRDDKHKNKLAQLERLGIELKPLEDICGVEKQFYNPLATAAQGKYAEQIQKRKLLWANKTGETKNNPSTSTANTWVGTAFTHDEDGKVTAKFKRLMGIKGDLPASSALGVKPDILKKQEEMFTNMEQQYEVARATTHTQRGVGLGYASGGLSFPR